MNISNIQIPAKLHPLARWAHESERGERMVYFKGDLATERGRAHIDEICMITGDNLRRSRLAAANIAYEMMVKGLVHLTQERHGDHDHSYVMVSRGRGSLRNQTPVGRIESVYRAELAAEQAAQAQQAAALPPAPVSDLVG